MSIFHDELDNAAEAIIAGEWDKAETVLQGHLNKRVIISENTSLSELINTLNVYQKSLEASISMIKEKKPGAVQQINHAEMAIESVERKLKRLLPLIQSQK